MGATQPERRELAGALLYIEDNPVNVLLMREWARQFPLITLVVAETAGQGMKELSLRLPDLVLLDLQLPDLDGIAVLRTMRSTPHGATLPIVVLSASASGEDMLRARDAGATAYWLKPVNFRKIEADLRLFLSGGGLEDQ